MTDDRYGGDERDPLLVRQFLRDADPPGEQSTQTWPSATTREVRSQSALEGADDPTAILFLPPTPRRHRTRRRLLVMAVACAAILLGATVAGFAALRGSARPSGPAALPDAPIPALTGLIPASPAAAPTSPVTATTATATPSRSAGHHSSTPTTPGKSANAPTSAAETTAAPATGGKTTTPPAALAPAPPTARTGAIRGQNGLCLALTGDAAVDFNRVQVLDCNGTSAQTWTLATDGTLRVLGMCALITGDDSVHVTACDTRTTARWRTSGQLLINAANDECLADPSAGTASGTAVEVATCTGRAGQRWSLP